MYISFKRDGFATRTTNQQKLTVKCIKISASKHLRRRKVFLIGLGRLEYWIWKQRGRKRAILRVEVGDDKYEIS